MLGLLWKIVSRSGDNMMVWSQHQAQSVSHPSQLNTDPRELFTDPGEVFSQN